MSQPSEIITLAYVASHCTEQGCKKCAARSRWNRRKAWGAEKSLRRSASKQKKGR